MDEIVTIGAGKENVLIVSGAAALTVIPHLGGKIASLRLDGRELLHAPLAPLAPRTRTIPFENSDASGWDECLPSVSQCSLETATGRVSVPDHGDLWRVPWEPSDGDSGRASLRAKCFSLPLTLQRSMALVEEEDGAAWRLSLNYELTNTSHHPVPWSWAAHPLFAVEPGDRIVLPPSVHSMRVEGSAGDRLGKSGDWVSWPHATLRDGTLADLRMVQPSESGIGDKLFGGPVEAEDNWCVLERPSAGIRIRISFDSARTPYIGLWLCYGGWPDRAGPKQMCVALEPSTAPVDSLTQTGVWSRSLDPGETYTWPMYIQFELI